MAFEIDGINYMHPYDAWNDSVYVRPMIQIFDDGARLLPMHVNDNTPKRGLMDSPVDEDFVKCFWRD